MKCILIIGGIILYVIVYLMVFLFPSAEKVKETEKALVSARADLAKIQRETKRLEEIKQLITMLETQAQELEKKFAKKKDVPYIIRTVSRVAEINGVELTNFSIDNINPGPIYDELPITLSCSTDYHSLAKFLTDICQQDKIFSVKEVSITQTTGKRKRTINCNLVLVFYIFK